MKQGMISKEQVIGRDPYIDNARFILVTLVVFGHLISPYRNENEIVYVINNFLASFRMPH
ncbi:hypothetical protein [Litchfieldia alkalitelluris]|uniref:hypothetical protein n=1 Tax=Litchfieldia alkalitelluris TaxID=304268 RepID=UPI000997A515|nr:hypothetical protein [Litchfieldia alkalitelluris]